MALVAMGLAVFVVANDFTALSVALPTIERQFNADVASVQWVINAYALVFGVLIVTELVRADEAQAVAHRIAIGELPMYPPPEPGEGVQDARSGSLAMPLAVLMVVLVGVIVYAVVR